MAGGGAGVFGRRRGKRWEGLREGGTWCAGSLRGGKGGMVMREDRRGGEGRVGGGGKGRREAGMLS